MRKNDKTNSEKLMSTIGDNVLRLRKTMRYTQSDLGFYSDTDGNYINSLECGRRNNIELSTLIKIADALETSVIDLLSDWY